MVNDKMNKHFFYQKDKHFFMINEMVSLKQRFPRCLDYNSDLSFTLRPNLHIEALDWLQKHFK